MLKYYVRFSFELPEPLTDSRLLEKLHINRGYHMAARGYEFYVQVLFIL